MNVLSFRFRICILMMLGLSASVSMRSHFSMTIVCMLTKPPLNAVNTSTSILDPMGGCPSFGEVDLSGGGDANRTHCGNLGWSRSLTPYLFTIVLVGQLLTLIASMHFADRCSPKKMMTIAVLLQIIVSFISPFLASTSFWAFFVGRLAMGIGEGLVFAPCNSLATRWFLPEERASMIALFTSAYQIAFGLAPLFVSIICDHCEYWGGWSSVFYIFGGVSMLWLVVWQWFGSSGPEGSTHIKEREKELLMRTMPKTRKEDRVNPPYNVLLKSPVLLTHIFAMVAFYFTIGLTASFLPLYYEERLRLPIAKNGLFTAAPFVAQILMKNVLALVLDALKRRKVLGHTVAAKIAQTIGSFGSGFFFLLLALFGDCSRPNVTLVFVFLGCALYSCCAVGFYSSMLMLCPPLTGTITAFVVGAGVISSIVATATVGATSSLWYKYELAFTLAAVLNILAGILYLRYGTAKRQPWLTPTIELQLVATDRKESEEEPLNQESVKVTVEEK